MKKYRSFAHIFAVYFQKSPIRREHSVIELKSDAGDDTMMLAGPGVSGKSTVRSVTVRISKQLPYSLLQAAPFL